jgi:hypothetical protein
MGAHQNPDLDDPGDEKHGLSVMSIFRAYRYQAARSAILSPFYSFSLRNDVVPATFQLRTTWRNRLTDLRHAGWHAVNTEKKLQYMRNCPPVGFLLARKTRVCNKPHVCPFCWGRQRVLLPFREFETILYGATGKYVGDNGKLLPLIRPDLKIVWFVTRTTGSAGIQAKFPVLAPETVGGHWDYVRANMNKNRDVEVRAFNAEYGSVTYKVYPMARDNRLGVIRAGVLLVPDDKLPDFVTRLAYANDGGRMDVLEPSKKNLMKATRKAFAFPRPIMTASPALTAGLLNRMYYSRMQTWYGPKPKTTIEE